MKFNINNHVKVKLTVAGIVAMEKDHAVMKAMYPKYPDFQMPRIDEKGYTEFQMWVLMETFGKHMTWGGPEPFEMDIQIADKDLEPDEVEK